jgi:RNA-directed DNA polymerase
MRTEYITKILELAKQKRKLPSREAMDPNYRRMTYVRYADDFLIGVIGSKADAEAIRARVTAFLKDTLYLDVSPEKTRVVHAKDGAQFLGYHIRTKTGVRVSSIAHPDLTAKQRSHAGTVILRAPRTKVEAFVRKHGYGDLSTHKATHRTNLLQSSDYEIVAIYNAELRGFATYYQLDQRVKEHLSELGWMASVSLQLTLASKHRMNTSWVRNRYMRAGRIVATHTREGQPDKEIRQWALSDWHPSKTPAPANVDIQPKGELLALSRTDVADRLRVEECENILCTSPPGTPLQVHHVRALADMRGVDRIVWLRSARQRRTRYLCVQCHLMTRTNAKDRQVRYTDGEPCAIKVASTVRREGALRSESITEKEIPY